MIADSNRSLLVKGVRHKAEMKSLFAGQLFEIENSKGIYLNKLPATILQGFEHNDIIENKIATDKKVNRIHKSSFKTQNLSDTLKNRIYDSLVAKYESCFAKNDTTYFLSVKKTHIHNELLLITDSFRIGKVDIVSGNNCFTESGSSYGGGILHYIIYPNNDIKFLVTNTELIDVADYDDDGKYEYIFFKSWFNNYGYIIYYNNFKSHATNEWSYH